MANTTTWTEPQSSRIPAKDEWGDAVDIDTQSSGNSPFSLGAAKWLIAIAAFTTPLSYRDPVEEFRRSGVSSVYGRAFGRKRVRISLLDARRMALALLADAEQRLALEREEEQRLVEQMWQDGEESF